jgi:hypothetical protein
MARVPTAIADTSTRKPRRGGLWVVLLLLIAGLLWWANTPLTDNAPTGVINNAQTSQEVQCDSVLSGNAAPTKALPPLPEGRAFERPPCRLVHDHNLHLFELDLALLVAAAFALLALRRRDARQPGQGIAAQTTVSDSSN